MAKKKRDMHPVARRLEQVRRRSGHPDMMAFWRALGGDATGTSYASARRYHTTREASPGYLAVVVDAYPEFRLEWLITGREPRTWAEAFPWIGDERTEQLVLAEQAARQGFEASIPTDVLNPAARGALDTLLAVAAPSYPPGPEHARPGVPAEVNSWWRFELAERLGEALAAPFASLGFTPQDVSPVLAMCRFFHHQPTRPSRSAVLACQHGCERRRPAPSCRSLTVGSDTPTGAYGPRSGSTCRTWRLRKRAAGVTCVP